jgi:hypothetical protein
VLDIINIDIYHDADRTRRKLQTLLLGSRGDGWAKRVSLQTPQEAAPFLITLNLN